MMIIKIGFYDYPGGVTGSQGLHLYNSDGLAVATTTLPSFDGTYKEVVISYNRGNHHHHHHHHNHHHHNHHHDHHIIIRYKKYMESSI